MTDVRYVGSAPWDRVVTKENKDGLTVAAKTVRVKPGEVVKDLDEDAVKRLTDSSIPRHMRTFVEVDGPEDRMGKQFQPNRRESISETSNASPYPELDFGSTVQPGRPQFLTPEEAEALGYDPADPSEGTPSDNEEATLIEQARQEVHEAYLKKLKDLREKRDSDRKDAAKRDAAGPRRDGGAGNPGVSTKDNKGGSGDGKQ